MKVIIIGGGQVGAYIANILLDNHCDVKVIEHREHVYEKLRNDIPEKNIVFGSGTDPYVLESAGIGKADVVAAVTGQDETNLMAATIAKFEFDVPRVIARVNNPKNTWLFDAGMGVDVGLNQADLMAHLVVEEMNQDAMMTLMKFSRGEYSIVEYTVASRSTAVQKYIKELPFPQNSVIIAIEKGARTVVPHGDDRIEEGDRVLAFADAEAQEQLNELFSDKK